MGINKLNFHNDPNIGLYGFGTDEYCLIGNIEKDVDRLKKNLEVPIIGSSISGTNLPGIFCAGNSSGIIVPNIIKKKELTFLEKKFEVLKIDSKYTALGNLILMNDNGIIISKKIEDHKDAIIDFFNLDVSIFEDRIDIIGSLSVCNNKGCIISKFIDKNNIKLIEDKLKINADYATINFGSNFVKSGVITNSNGLFLGDLTSGPEMDRVSEILGFV